jgi:two-component system LytT family sensor kinase
MREALQPYYWRFQIVGWALFCLLNQVWGYLLLEGVLGYFLIDFLLSWFSLLLGSHVVFELADRNAWLAMSASRLWARVLCACLVMGHLCVLPNIVFYQSSIVLIPDQMQQLLSILEFQQVSMAYMVVSGGFLAGVKLTLWFLIVWVIYQQKQGLKLRGRQRVLELELQNAQMDQLRQQLNPHFLFNCLNSIRAMIHIDKDASSRMVDELTRILRYTLQKSDDCVALSEELEVVDSYLSLEQARLGDRLQVKRTISAAAMDFRMPPFLLQTLVENAIKHGISQRIRGGRVDLEGSVSERGLTLVIRNDGELNRDAAGLGIGLNNSRERLRLLYGRDDLLSIRQEGSLVVSTLLVPAEARAETQDEKRAEAPAVMRHE